jgi:hypothetical protein
MDYRKPRLCSKQEVASFSLCRPTLLADVGERVSPPLQVACRRLHGLDRRLRLAHVRPRPKTRLTAIQVFVKVASMSACDCHLRLLAVCVSDHP